MDNSSNMARLIDSLLEKTESGALKWQARDTPGSFRVQIGDFDVHVDNNRKDESGYEVWVFDDRAGLVDSILRFDYIGDMKDYKEKVKDLYIMISNLVTNDGLKELNELLDKM